MSCMSDLIKIILVIPFLVLYGVLNLLLLPLKYTLGCKVNLHFWKFKYHKDRDGFGEDVYECSKCGKNKYKSPYR